MRASGILMHISSLPSPHGIGTFGQAAFEFVDFLERAGQRCWQVLPLGPTSFGDSPYQSFSTFAGNPYFIDLDLLEAEGLLEKNEYQGIDWGTDPRRTDYEKLYNNRFAVLHKAFCRGIARDADEIAAFREKHAAWVEDYALFMAVKTSLNGCSWDCWPAEIRLRKPEALAEYRSRMADDILFWIYLQYQFYNQWFAVKRYANRHGVQIIGDVPIYVAMDSADVWANPRLFQLDEELRPTHVAGVPPDYFAPQGQLWGNPLYDWDAHRQEGYAWWIERVRAATTFFDTVRIDHFRAFSGYYAIPFGDEDATGGHWEKGPRLELFDTLKDALGECSIIAEDLGDLDADVYRLLEQSGFPGMKVLQFAFDSNWDNAYLPHNHKKNCVVYTGTHDNDTLMHWWATALSPHDRRHAADYICLNEREGLNWGLLRAVWSSVADLAIAPIQDFLALGGEARMNTPSVGTGNWQFRLEVGRLTPALAEKIERMSGLYQRSAL